MEDERRTAVLSVEDLRSSGTVRDLELRADQRSDRDCAKDRGRRAQ